MQNLTKKSDIVFKNYYKHFESVFADQMTLLQMVDEPLRDIKACQESLKGAIIPR